MVLQAPCVEKRTVGKGSCHVDEPLRIAGHVDADGSGNATKIDVAEDIGRIKLVEAGPPRRPRRRADAGADQDEWPRFRSAATHARSKCSRKWWRFPGPRRCTWSPGR